MPRERRQHVADESLAEDVSLFINQDEEERLVFDNRPAETRAKLVAVLVVLRNAVKVVEPLAGVERGVAIRPECTASERVRSGACHHLHLPGSAPDLGVDRRGDDAYLLDQVGTGVRACQGAIVVSPIGDVEAVSRDIYRVEPSAGKEAVEVVFGWTCAAGGSKQVHHIAATQGKVADFIFGKHCSHRG